ncbi:hypothetical protein LR48_Vigan10g263100 [Vigna angularis]|uniref:Uncharacterized protein n=1 Tax=Phaseolus angularis TaxID=3914 RepID=A0A0L9VPR1_PHAAN|nr:hypothetical protein LR48_Vigan10g263100 [Vigna angularis]
MNARPMCTHERTLAQEKRTLVQKFMEDVRPQNREDARPRNTEDARPERKWTFGQRDAQRTFGEENRTLVQYRNAQDARPLSVDTVFAKGKGSLAAQTRFLSIGALGGERGAVGTVLLHPWVFFLLPFPPLFLASQNYVILDSPSKVEIRRSKASPCQGQPLPGLPFSKKNERERKGDSTVSGGASTISDVAGDFLGQLRGCAAGWSRRGGRWLPQMMKKGPQVSSAVGWEGDPSGF